MDTPGPDSLGGGRFGRLSVALRGRRAEVLAAWEAAVRRAVADADAFTVGQLLGTIQAAVDQICTAVDDARPDAAARLAERTREHGTVRFGQRYTAAELMTEYQLLRRVVFEQVEAVLDGSFAEGEMLALNRAVDAVAQGGVTGFVEAQRLHVVAAAEVQSQFLAYLAHDQRNHLNHALLLLEVHTAEVGEHADLRDSLSDLTLIRRAIGETTAGMERLMEAERLRQVAGQAERRTFAVADLLRSVADVHAGPAGAKAIVVTVAAPPAATLTSDPDLIRLALNNLVGNAIKFADHGSVRLSATEPAAGGDGRWTLGVADDGPGITPDRIGRLFDAFARGETHGQGGMGLGLSIASGAARLLGGSLTVTSTVGVGSTFTLTVPCGPADLRTTPP